MESPKITIGVADDHTLMRNALISVIHECKQFQVIVDAENGKELLGKISTLPKPPDVCIVDISMPILNGYDTTFALKQKHPDMKVLALTAFEKEYSIIRMIKNGANGYLLKSCEVQEFHDAILSVYSTGYYYSKIASEKAFSVVQNNHLPDLTTHELEFLCLCPSDLGYLELAEKMGISVHTIQEYQKRVSKKLHIHTRKDLALFAVYVGLAPLNKSIKHNT